MNADKNRYTLAIVRLAVVLLVCPPIFPPGVGWVGFGTLPQSQNNPPRAVIVSAKLVF